MGKHVRAPGRLLILCSLKVIFFYYQFNLNAVELASAWKKRGMDGEGDPRWQYSIFPEWFSSDPKLARYN